MKRLYSVTFWSLSVQIGGGCGHRIQVVVFDKLLNTCFPKTKTIRTGRKRSSRSDGHLLDVFIRKSLTVLYG